MSAWSRIAHGQTCVFKKVCIIINIYSALSHTWLLVCIQCLYVVIFPCQIQGEMQLQCPV